MGRWLFLGSCVSVLLMLWLGEPQRGTGGRHLGGTCERDLDCLVGMSCADLDGVLVGQCTAACNHDGACRDDFGSASMCIGADRCVRTCQGDTDCARGTACNTYGWCEAAN